MPPELMTEEDRLKLDPQMVAFLQSRGQAPAAPRAPAAPVEAPPMRSALSSLDPKIIDYLQQHDAEAKDYNAKQDLREGVGRSMNYFMGKPVSPNMGPPKVDDEMQKFLIHQSTLRNYGAMNDPMRLPPSEDQIQRAIAGGMPEPVARGAPTLGSLVTLGTRPPPKPPEAETYIPIPGSGIAVGKHDPSKQVPLPPPIPKPAAPAGHGGAHGALGPDEAKALGDAIISGKQPPDVETLRNAGPGVRAYLATQGFDLVAAKQDWEATKKHISTLNGPQQTRLLQTLESMPHQLDNVQSLYDKWKSLAPVSGIKVLNRLSLASSKNMGGEIGAVATNLEAQIIDMSAEISSVYMGGNSPTDKALAMAQHNLSSDWDDPTFTMGMTLLRKNVQIRKNSITNSPIGGASPGNPYAPRIAPAVVPGAPSAKNGPVSINSDADYAALPSGAEFIGPDGKHRRKP